MKQHMLLIMFVAVFVLPIVIMSVQHFHLFDGMFDVCSAMKSAASTQNSSCATNTAP